MSPSLEFWRKVVESSVKLCAESRLKAVTPGPRQKVTLGQVCSDQFKISLMLSLVSELCPPCLDRGGGDTSNAHGPVVCTGAVTRHSVSIAPDMEKDRVLGAGMLCYHDIGPRLLVRDL